MVHWKRDLDLYTIGRPLERNAGFWLDYMKGLKGEQGDKPILRRPLPRAVSVGPSSPIYPSIPAAYDPWDPLSSPGLDLPLSPAYDDLRDMIDRARQRYRQRRAEMMARGLDF